MKQSAAELSRKPDNVERYGRKLNERNGNYKYVVGESTNVVVISVAKRGDELDKEETDVLHLIGKNKDSSPSLKFRTIQTKIKFL